MTSWAIVTPVLAGKSDEALKLADYLKSHAKEYQESRRRAGITLERVYQMTTPMGEFTTVYFEGNDPMKAFETIASSTQPIDKWFVEKVREVHGMDMSQRGPAPEPLIEWIGDRAHKNGLAWCLPVLPGKVDELRKFSKDLSGPRFKEFQDSRRSKGLTRSVAYLTHSPNGDFVAVYVEGDDPQNSLRQIAQSNAPFDTWFRQQINAYSGVDYSKAMTGIKTALDSLALTQPAGVNARA